MLQNIGGEFLRGSPLKQRFAHFAAVGKVGRARKRETLSFSYSHVLSNPQGSSSLMFMLLASPFLLRQMTSMS